MTKPFVSVIIVNYNSSHIVAECLLSLSNQTYKGFEILVIDNASNDNSLEAIHKIIRENDFVRTRIKLLRSKKNLGFSKAANIGICTANGDYIVFLNPDVIVSNTWLEELVKAVLNNENLALCQSKILFPDGRINTAGGLCDKYLFTRNRGYKEFDLKQYDKLLKEFFFASGASCLIKKKVLKDVGLLDGDLFLYYDDVDLSWRVRLIGYDIYYVPESICMHFEKVSVNKLPQSKLLTSYYSQRNRIRIFLKNYAIHTLLKRFPILLISSLLESLYLAIKERERLFLIAFLLALLWNLRNLKDTLSKRKLVQQMRIRGDDEIEKYMNKVPFIIDNFKRRVNSNID